MKTIAERLKRVKTVTASYNLLADYIFLSLYTFMQQTEEGYNRAAERYRIAGDQYFKSIAASWCAVVLQAMRDDLGKKKKEFLRITKENFDRNFEKGKSND